jgi:hypothetical protein
MSRYFGAAVNTQNPRRTSFLSACKSQNACRPPYFLLLSVDSVPTGQVFFSIGVNPHFVRMPGFFHSGDITKHLYLRLGLSYCNREVSSGERAWDVAARTRPRRGHTLMSHTSVRRSRRRTHAPPGSRPASRKSLQAALFSTRSELCALCVLCGKFRRFLASTQ